MEQKTCLKYIYKIHSKQLKKANWKLNLPLQAALKEYPECVVSINDSQLLRFIDEINGIEDITAKVRSIQKQIKVKKKEPNSKRNRETIRELYASMYDLQFQKDYICIIMDSNKDYDRANLGFSVNGIKYRRFLGTNGGIKNSTIVYVNAEIYDELKNRLDNGRNKSKEFVPAKLEAYQALICSGSIPVPEPKGIIVVKDCITHFKDNIIMINDESDGEPVMSEINGYNMEHNDSDGYGLMLPEYARKVNLCLNGVDTVLSGMNTRYAWTKGMLYTFDFIEFAEKIAQSYEVIDVWGDKRDIRNCEVILTESMLKLWDSYDSWEDYYNNCVSNHYQFSVTKTCPEELESVRNTNYQFLQSYDLSDNELMELCQPTIDEIKDVLGLDYRKSLTFLCGFGLNEKNSFSDELDYHTKALMINQDMINDPYVRKKIWNMIEKRIEMAKRGAIQIYANFAMISGDPYALCQSIFELEVIGLLNAGELYHKYWIDKDADELVCFRAPMTCHNNIRKLKLNKSDECAYWYQYIKTAIILNAWDTTCDAMNGADKDGDTNMDTDNPILLKNTLNSPTIICVQRKSVKKVPTEEDIILSNKLAFNDDIGVVTNRATSMFEIQAGFDSDSEEYKTLSYRIKCGQLYQQNVIDRAKGVIAKPMPKYWYNLRDNVPKSEDSPEEKRKKKFNYKITAAHKPYFMTYIYPNLRTENRNFNADVDKGVLMRFGKYGIETLDDLLSYEPKTKDMEECLRLYQKKVGENPCLVNRMCWIFEKEFDGYLSQKKTKAYFDYSILKSGVKYSDRNYKDILAIYKDYQAKLNSYMRKSRYERTSDTVENKRQRELFIQQFKYECETICSNQYELCDIVLDICYGKEKSKQFAWDICGEIIIENLLNNNNRIIHYPEQVDQNGEFEYGGKQFIMAERIIGEENDYTE